MYVLCLKIYNSNGMSWQIVFVLVFLREISTVFNDELFCGFWTCLF